MCDCNKSSFFPFRETKLYSNFSDSQLRAQCAQENGLDANDPKNQYILDACVKEKNKSYLDAVDSNDKDKKKKVIKTVAWVGGILLVLITAYIMYKKYNKN